MNSNKEVWFSSNQNQPFILVKWQKDSFIIFSPGIVSGKAFFFYSLDKPVFIDALMLTIFCIPSINTKGQVLCSFSNINLRIYFSYG